MSSILPQRGRYEKANNDQSRKAKVHISNQTARVNRTHTGILQVAEIRDALLLIPQTFGHSFMFI